MKKPNLGSAVYVLPNLITTGNLFFGFFSIVKSLNGDFRWAASALILAAIFDVLDGRVARLTGGTSEFGVQYDSLCDLVSFGLAPAVLMYRFGLGELGRPGWILCFLFLACGALRLARFNVQSSIGKASGDFTGLPIPASAAVIATFVLVSIESASVPLVSSAPSVLAYAKDWINTPEVRKCFLVAAGLYLPLVMVSNFAFRSHKMIRLGSMKPFRILVIAVAVLGLTAYEPELIGLIVSVVYALSGPFEWLAGWKKPLDDDDIFAPTQSVEPEE